MSHFTIKGLMWSGRMVGLADHKLTANNTVRIEQKNAEGVYMYPGIFVLTGEQARKYTLRSFPSKKVGGVTPPLRMVPVADLVKNRVEE